MARFVLAETSLPPRTTRRFPPYAVFADPAEARLAIIRLHSEGWTRTSIAAHNETSRQTVHTTPQCWIDEGISGLDDKRLARTGGVRKVDPRTMALVRELQEHPELGEFRVHAALKQVGVERRPRTCGRILALNRRLYGLPGPARLPHEPKEMPFNVIRCHQYWTVDIRYLDYSLDEDKVYWVPGIENFGRSIRNSPLMIPSDHVTICP